MLRNRMPPDLASQFLKTAQSSVPLAIEQIDIMLRLIGAARDPITRFLDLGSGDGVLSAAILERVDVLAATRQPKRTARVPCMKRSRS